MYNYDCQNNLTKTKLCFDSKLAMMTKMKSIKNVTIIAEAKHKIPLTLETCVTISIIQNMFTKRNSLLLKCDILARRF